MDVLVATLGVEPQVVTLTLDALRGHGFPVVSAFIVHTNPLLPSVRDALQRLRQERNFYQRCQPPVRFTFVPICSGDHFPQDIATEGDVALLLRVLYRTVADQKRKGHRVHLSIAGGRKVMTAMGMVVAQLLLDERDRVWHLLSEGALLQTKAMHADDPNEVVLVPVPVLRWSLLPSTVQELLVWDDPYRAIQRQRELQQHQRWQILNTFWAQLTTSEREVVEALVRYGGTIAELSKHLNRAPKTVANQLQSIYAKYRDSFGLLATVKVRDRLIADFAPVIAAMGETTQKGLGETAQALKARR